jgi:phage FluMu protein gp41
MSSYLNKLIEDVKRELDHERARVEHETFATKRIEARETGNLKRLEQRVQVLEQLKAKEAATNRRRALSFARASRDRGHGSAKQRRRQEHSSKRAG